MTEISTVKPTLPESPRYPYSPSWVDRFTDWVDRLPIPFWLFYAGFAAILIGIELLIQWNGSIGPAYPFPLAYICTIAYDLALIHYLDKVAAQALARFRPLMSVSDSEYEMVLYRLTTLPTRPVLLSALIGALCGLSILDWVPYSVKIYELHFVQTPLSIHFNNGLSPLVWAVVGVVVFHTLHQLRVVQQIYSSCKNIDLYKLGPLYAFSTLSARTAVGIGLIAYLWYVFAPQLFNFALPGFVFFTVLSFLTFMLPLTGARRLLVEEKYKQLSNNGELQRIVTAELHRRVDASDLADMDNLNKTMASLEMEHTTLDRISTWPWQPETARAVAAALLFPVMVWLTQWVLQRILES